MAGTVKKITWEVRIAGQKVPNVVSVESSAGFEQINSEAGIVVSFRPSWVEEGQTATIWATRGSLSGQIFGGEVNQVDWEYAPGLVKIVCRDLLARTRLEWGGDEYEYTSQDDAAVIRNLLEKMGIPSSAASIESSSWTLGTVESLILKEGVAPYSLIAPIDDLAGYRTYSLTTGVIVRRRISGVPGASGSLTFSKGVNILTNARRSRTRDGIVNRVIVTGVDYEGLTVGGPGVGEASAPNPYIPNPPGYITESIQSNLVEDDAKALEIATRRVSDKNRRPEGLDFQIPFDPRAQPGMTVLVEHSSLETGSATVFVSYVGHSLSSSGALTTLRTTGGNLSGFALQDPVASFDVQLFREGEDTGSGVNTILVGVADGSASFDPDGTIASYAWAISATGGTPDPTSGSSSVFRFTVDGATTEIVLALTVTDADVGTNTLSRTISITSSVLLVEDLYLAYGDVACSSDGEQTWRTATPASGSATCLASFAPDWGEAWGTSTGHVYATFDKLQSALVDLGQPHGAVACTAIWVHELDQTRLWAGFSDGKVYKGVVDTVAHTCAFTLAGTIPDSPVYEIRESYGTLGELRATAGASYYYSATAGASWTLVYTFDVAARMTAGFDQNIATGLNSTPPIFGEDITPTVPGGVTHLRGVTFGWRTQALYATDDAAGLYTSDDTFAALTAHADTLDAIGNHMIRSGNIDGPVIYASIGDGTGVNNGFQKWIPGTKQPFYIKKTGSAAGHQLGFGPAHPPPLAYRIYAGWDNANPGGMSVWDAGTWTNRALGTSGTNVRCIYLAASPTDPDKVLGIFNKAGAPNAGTEVDTSGATVQGYGGWAHSPLWYWDGATWTEVSLTKPGSGLGGNELMYTVEWAADGSGWLTTLASAGSAGGAYYYGVAGTASAPVPTPAQSLPVMRSGLDGDFILQQTNGGGKVSYLNGATLTQPTGATATYTFAGMDRVFGSRQMVIVDSSGNILGAGDYRAAQPVIILPSLNARTLTSAVDALYMVDGTGALYRIVNPFTGGVGTLLSTIAVGAPRSDRQSQTVVAITGSTSVFLVVGGTGLTLAGPAGKTLSGAVEVVTE